MGNSPHSRRAGFWRRFWLARGGSGWSGRVATRLAALRTHGTSERFGLAALTPRGYIDPSAELIDADLRLGSHVFVGERVILACWKGMVRRVSNSAWGGEQGFIELEDWVRIDREADLEVFEGGFIRVGREALIQARCVLLGLIQPISIGRRAIIGPYCAFFPYDHRFVPGEPMFDQPLVSKGPIVVEDDARLGAGVTVLSGVTIGRGATVRPGSVVTRDIPAGAIASGSPARVETRERTLDTEDSGGRGVAVPSRSGSL